MQAYLNLSGDSGVAAFDIGADYIDVEFQHGGTYRYDYARPGGAHVEQMKLCAQAGQGLATYINQHVRKNFAQKL